MLSTIVGIIAQTGISTLCYIGIAIASTWDEDIRHDMNAIGWNPFNKNESATINSNKVSFYRGVPVFKTTMDRSGSYYAIFLNQHSDEAILRHERGHNTQAMLLGPVKYGLMIFVPSALELSTRSYYERPWEITADVWGGVNSPHSQADISRGYWYFVTSWILGPAGYLFLLGEY